MSDIGPILKKARLDKNLTLDDLQELTKIRKKYLEAIEDNNYRVLPGAFYIKAFIKSYADAVGLHPQEVINLHDKSTPIPEEDMPIVEPIRTNKSNSPRNIEKINRWISNTVMVSFVLLVVAIFYFFAIKNNLGVSDSNKTESQNANRITEQKNLTTVSPKSTPTATPSPTISPSPQPAVALIFDKNENGVDHYTISNVKAIDLKYEIVGEKCWVQVDTIDEQNIKTMQKQKSYILGETDQFILSKSTYLNIGIASAVKLNVNGIDIPFGNNNNPIRIQLNLQKIE